ncbi:MAG: PH domain-containing protein [Candidatus Micrarchaeota archaeon]
MECIPSSYKKEAIYLWVPILIIEFIIAMTNFHIIDVELTILSIIDFRFTYVIAMLIALFAVFYTIYLVLKHKNTFIKVEEDRIVYYEGILNKTTVSIPYSKIENVNTHQDILSRMLGLVDLKIHSAATEKADIEHYDAVYSVFKKYETKLKS